VYEALVEYGPGGELQPGLATSWTVAPDGLSVAFHLRQGVRFQDGTPFDAAAVAWNFARWVGQPDFGFFRASTAIQDVEVVDPATVTLHLSEPYAPLLTELSISRPVRMLSPASGAADGTFRQPVGTGPWRLESATDSGGVLVRNDDYWGPRPSVERVEVSVIPDSQTRVAALRSGQVDLLGGAYMAPISNVEATSLRDAGIDVAAGEPDTTLLLGFNRGGIAGDQAVRRAISLATDVAGINRVLYGGASGGAGGLFPPSIKDAGAPAAHTFDLDAAAAALDDAGWVTSGGARRKGDTDLSLRLLLLGDAAHGQQDSTITGEALADALAGIGVHVSIDVRDGAAYFDALSRGEYDLAFFTTYGAPYDPSSSVTAFLHTGGGEAPIWNDEQLDRLVDAALFAHGEAATTAAYQSIFDHLADLDAFVPITHPPRFYATGPGVHGFDLPATEYDLPLATVTVER